MQRMRQRAFSGIAPQEPVLAPKNITDLRQLRNCTFKEE
jgi:hypothetical protein